MPPYQPNRSDNATYVDGSQVKTIDARPKEDIKDDYVYKVDIVWLNVFLIGMLHLFALYGTVLVFTNQVKLLTILFGLLYGWMSGIGVTGGSHRLWAHKAYKARWPMRLIMAYFQAAAFQNHIYEWVRDHRVHHKFCDTDADPHNSKRGFFFSHVGWLLVKKHRDVTKKGKTIDMTDLEKDWVVMFQKKHYLWFMPLSCFVVPSFIPWYFFGESGFISFIVAGVMRYTYVLNGTWCVNSVAHIWGSKPYDKGISASNNLFVSFFTSGEGWHNYHHSFPWDYKASELWNLNSTTTVIDAFAKIGWAYDLKETSEEMIRKRALRSGDGTEINTSAKKGNNITIEKDDNHHDGEYWGYDDKDLPQGDRSLIHIKKSV